MITNLKIPQSVERIESGQSFLYSKDFCLDLVKMLEKGDSSLLEIDTTGIPDSEWKTKLQKCLSLTYP